MCNFLCVLNLHSAGEGSNSQWLACCILACLAYAREFTVSHLPKCEKLPNSSSKINNYPSPWTSLTAGMVVWVGNPN